MKNVFYSNLGDILEILVIAPFLYVIVIFYIRVVGKRSTSQMNNFDWIVTVAIGSLIGSTIILKDVPLLNGAISILVLLSLQYLLTRSMFSFPIIKNMVRASPRLLLYRGQLMEENMKKERILEAEIMSAIRENGLKSMDQVYAVILETDANFSVIPSKDDNKTGLILKDVEGLPKGLKQKLDNKT